MLSNSYVLENLLSEGPPRLEYEFRLALDHPLLAAEFRVQLYRYLCTHRHPGALIHMIERMLLFRARQVAASLGKFDG